MARATVTPIGPNDLEKVGEFLHRNLNSRISASDWARSVETPWSVDAPNHGYMLRNEQGDVAGTYLAFYSDRTIDGRHERFCNLAAWCVAPEHRLDGLRLLRALLGQPGYHFTDLSPSGNTVPINERLGFTRLDTAVALMPNLPWPSLPGRHRVSSRPAVIESVLTEAELKIYRDHRNARAARQLVMTIGDEHCHVIFRRDRRKQLPLFGSVLYVSNPKVFRKLARPFARHLLLHHRIPFTLLELRVVGDPPFGSFRLKSSRPKMFKSDTLPPNSIDNLYSELTCVAW